MSLSPGTRLGHYDVTALIGEGGMGQVWQATDTTLNRQVALKILPDAFAEDPDRLARFQREAQVLASLNHPNIAAIYGLEQGDDTRALVLELVEGPTLADRIAQGSIPVDEALPIAKQIAEALEAAHEQGVIHRDLKPANIKVRSDGTVKVLDFGLAKALDTAPPGDPAQSPTLTAAATQMGVIMGTAAYMSPEQARGKPVDKRTDIWAFGVVLFEMLTGQRVFFGETTSEMLAEVMKAEPAWDRLPPEMPASLVVVLRRCIEKGPEQRVRDIGDVRLALDGAFETTAGTAATAVPPPVRLWQRPMLALIMVALAAGLSGVIVWRVMRPEPLALPITRVSLMLPEDQRLGFTGRRIVALSPDGTKLVYVADEQLYLRSMDQLAATPVRGTEGAMGPFFSADGQSVGFWAENQLKRVSVTGDMPVPLCDVANVWGASWGPDDTILFGRGEDGIWHVPGAGGTPYSLVPVAEGELAHGPQPLPGGDWVLYTLRPAGARSWDEADIVVSSVVTGERKVVLRGGRDARYLPTGHLVYARDGELLAVPFDADRREVTGGEVALVEGVGDGGPFTGAAHFSPSRTGSLVYVPTTALAGGAEFNLVWVDRAGREEVAFVEPTASDLPRLSPSGDRVAVQLADAGTTDVAVLDLTRQTRERLTFDPGIDERPIWTPDGSRIVFVSSRDGGGLFSKAADGTGEVDVLLNTDRIIWDLSWLPDGSLVTSDADVTGGPPDISVLSAQGNRTLTPLIDDDAVKVRPALSPNGDVLAYVSNESGSFQVYVTSFPNVGEIKRRVSTDGGTDPVWSPDGRELFYRCCYPRRGPGQLLSATVETDPALHVGQPHTLFQTGPFAFFELGRSYDIAPSGDRFLMRKPSSAATETGHGFILVLNWLEELRARVPVD